MQRQLNVDDVSRLQRRITGARRRATTAILAPHVRVVDPARACGTHPRQRYWEDCFRRAAEYVLERALRGGHCLPLEGVTLVHGTCRDGHLCNQVVAAGEKPEQLRAHGTERAVA